jgi:hypothetical protein
VSQFGPSRGLSLTPDPWPPRGGQKEALKYSPDQARDEDGRWTSGGGGDPIGEARELNAGQRVTFSPGAIQSAMGPWSVSSEPIKLQNATVSGAGNASLFMKGSLGIPRGEMPQVPGDAAGVGKFEDLLRSVGAKYRTEDVDPRTLLSTQGELDGRSVAKIEQSLEKSGGILRSDGANLVVSQDGHILDGHHRWAAAAIYAINHPGERVHVVRVSEDIKTLMGQAEQFDVTQGISHSAFGQTHGQGEHFDKGAWREFVPPPPGAVPPDPRKPYIWVDGGWLLLHRDTDDGVPRQLFKAWRPRIVKYSPDQPRDADGRWGDGGGETEDLRTRPGAAGKPSPGKSTVGPRPGDVLRPLTKVATKERLPQYSVKASNGRPVKMSVRLGAKISDKDAQRALSALADVYDRTVSMLPAGDNKPPSLRLWSVGGMERLVGQPDVGGAVDPANPYVINVSMETLDDAASKSTRGWDMPVADKPGMSMLAYTVAHEYGHTLDIRTDAPKRVSDNAAYTRIVGSIPETNPWAEQFFGPTVAEKPLKGMSIYGQSNPKEAYAEAFAEYQLSNGTTRDTASRAYAKTFGWKAGT